MDEVKITKELKDEILRQVRTNPRYMKLSAAYQQHRMNQNWIQAGIIGKQMEAIEKHTLEYVAKHYKHKQVGMSEILYSMSEEDRATMNAYANGLMMIADVIETMISELNQTVKKYHPDMSVISFNELNALAKEAKKQVASFDEVQKDEYAVNLFGTSCEKLFEMIFNKAKSFCTKINTHAKMLDKKAARNAEVA